MDNDQIFKTIEAQLTATDDNITAGKMMSSPAICYKKKVFAFFHDGKMTFKLGKDFEPESLGIKDYHLLSPFKNKPPMQAWFTISHTEKAQWKTLAIMALEHIQSDLG